MTPRCPKAFCLAATSSIAAPRCIGDKVIFGTLDAKLVALDAQDRQGRLEQGDRRFQGRLLLHRRAAHRRHEGTRRHHRHRRLGRRVRHRRPRRGPQGRQRRSRLVASDDRRAHGHAERQALDDDRQAGRVLAGRPVEDGRRRDLARRHVRSRDQPDLHRHRQPRPVEQPHASGRQQMVVRHASRSIPRPARSSGASRPRRTTAGTSTA